MIQLVQATEESEVCKRPSGAFHVLAFMAPLNTRGFRILDLQESNLRKTFPHRRENIRSFPCLTTLYPPKKKTASWCHQFCYLQAEEAMIDTAQKFVIGKLEELDEEELPVRLFSAGLSLRKGTFIPCYTIIWYTFIFLNGSTESHGRFKCTLGVGCRTHLGSGLRPVNIHGMMKLLKLGNSPFLSQEESVL